MLQSQWEWKEKESDQRSICTAGCTLLVPSTCCLNVTTDMSHCLISSPMHMTNDIMCRKHIISTKTIRHCTQCTQWQNTWWYLSQPRQCRNITIIITIITVTIITVTIIILVTIIIIILFAVLPQVSRAVRPACRVLPCRGDDQNCDNVMILMIKRIESFLIINV